MFGCKNEPKKETIEVDGKKINATTSTENNYEYSLADLTKEQTDFIADKTARAKVFIKKYHSAPASVPFDSKLLDEVLLTWANSHSADKESAEEVIDIIGTAFGQGLVNELNCEWKQLTDEYGTDITVINKKYMVNSFPFSSVEKVVTEDNPRSLDEIKLILKSQILDAENGGDIQERK